MTSIGLLLVQILVTHGPEIAADIATLLHSPDPTLEQWLAVFAKAQGKVNNDGTITLGQS